MEMRFPSSTPRVSRSAVLGGKDVVLIDGVQFEDGMRRLVVGPDISDDSMAALASALSEIDGRDGAIRWIRDVLANQVNGDTQ